MNKKTAAETSALRIFITGGAGFIGSALVRHLIANTAHQVLNFDVLTYAGSLTTVAQVMGSDRYRFVQGDICDANAVRAAIAAFQPDIITHLAAETHVDRSIDVPNAFVRANVTGTATILGEALAWWRKLDAGQRRSFRFHHISTDEVYGPLGDVGRFTEDTPYNPRSPYAASKAGADHLVAAWNHTYGLPVLLTNCANNYGPYQHPEKLIPLTIARALGGDELPVYGTGDQSRDWLFVEDHVRALQTVFERGVVGRRYNIGGNSELRNIDVVHAICALLDEHAPRRDKRSYAAQITHVVDRPGHDRRYAVDASRIRNELGWEPTENVRSGLEKTVSWYLTHRAWWTPLVAAGATQRRGV